MMENHVREYPQLAACGLNCGLCPSYYTNGPSKCPGCSGESFFLKRPTCGVISCCNEHGHIEYCYLCDEYPCEKYDNADKHDSFITHKNMFKNFDRIKETGLDEYKSELDEKIEILTDLLDHYNDGRHKSFYCLAVNLLDLEDVKEAMGKIRARVYMDDPIKIKVSTSVSIFNDMAELCGVGLTLNRRKQEK